MKLTLLRLGLPQKFDIEATNTIREFDLTYRLLGEITTRDLCGGGIIIKATRSVWKSVNFAPVHLSEQLADFTVRFVNLRPWLRDVSVLLFDHIKHGTFVAWRCIGSGKANA
ncbi:hypothetical protein J6590_070574 [Homalodisca vitripennis]|nr:hypothetical protein J6590_070574 [Homalodisca vitripennis]